MVSQESEAELAELRDLKSQSIPTEAFLAFEAKRSALQQQVERDEMKRLSKQMQQEAEKHLAEETQGGQDKIGDKKTKKKEKKDKKHRTTGGQVAQDPLQFLTPEERLRYQKLLQDKELEVKKAEMQAGHDGPHEVEKKKKDKKDKKDKKEKPAAESEKQPEQNKTQTPAGEDGQQEVEKKQKKKDKKDKKEKPAAESEKQPEGKEPEHKKTETPAGEDGQQGVENKKRKKDKKEKPVAESEKQPERKEPEQKKTETPAGEDGQQGVENKKRKKDKKEKPAAESEKQPKGKEPEQKKNEIPAGEDGQQEVEKKMSVKKDEKEKPVAENEKQPERKEPEQKKTETLAGEDGQQEVEKKKKDKKDKKDKKEKPAAQSEKQPEGKEPEHKKTETPAGQDGQQEVEKKKKDKKDKKEKPAAESEKQPEQKEPEQKEPEQKKTETPAGEDGQQGVENKKRKKDKKDKKEKPAAESEKQPEANKAEVPAGQDGPKKDKKEKPAAGGEKELEPRKTEMAAGQNGAEEGEKEKKQDEMQRETNAAESRKAKEQEPQKTDGADASRSGNDEKKKRGLEPSGQVGPGAEKGGAEPACKATKLTEAALAKIDGKRAVDKSFEAVPAKKNKPSPEELNVQPQDMIQYEKQKTLASIDLPTPSPPLARGLSFSLASVAGTPSTTSTSSTQERKTRMDVHNMDQTTKDAIAAMTVPQDMAPDERKRQYAALGRAIRRDAPPEVVAKFSMATDPERFGMLRQWMLNPDTHAITVEEKYRTWCQQLRSDKYVTVTIFQLEKLYGRSREAKSFIETLIKGQKGIDHPQGGGNPKAKMYKVLKEVAEDTSKGWSQESCASLGGRVKDVNARKMLAKQMGDLSSEFASMDMKTGQIKQRKPKKEVSAEQTAMKDLKTLEKRVKGLINAVPASLQDFETYGVRNCAELVEALQKHQDPLEFAHRRIIEQLQTPAASVNAEELNDFINEEKTRVREADQDVKDAQRRIRAVKPKQKRSRGHADEDVSDSAGAQSD